MKYAAIKCAYCGDMAENVRCTSCGAPRTLSRRRRVELPPAVYRLLDERGCQARVTARAESFNGIQTIEYLDGKVVWEFVCVAD